MENTTLKNKLATIIQDTREKNPFDFNGDGDFAGVKVDKLDSADYSIDGLQEYILIERKQDVNELLSNFYFARSRIIKEMERLRLVKHAFIVIEQDLADILNPMSYYVNISRKNKKGPNVPVAVVMSNLLNIMLKYNIQVIFAGAHGKQITKSLLLAAAKKYASRVV